MRVHWPCYYCTMHESSSSYFIYRFKWIPTYLIDHCVKWALLTVCPPPSYSKGSFLDLYPILVTIFRQNKWVKSSSQSPLYRPDWWRHSCYYRVLKNNILKSTPLASLMGCLGCLLWKHPTLGCLKVWTDSNGFQLILKSRMFHGSSLTLLLRHAIAPCIPFLSI